MYIPWLGAESKVGGHEGPRIGAAVDGPPPACRIRLSVVAPLRLKALLLFGCTWAPLGFTGLKVATAEDLIILRRRRAAPWQLAAMAACAGGARPLRPAVEHLHQGRGGGGRWLWCGGVLCPSTFR